MNKKLLTAFLGLACLCGSATAQEATEYVFNPGWYLQGQVGIQETLGETSFGKLVAPNAQIAVGYKWNPIFGARLAVNGWESKASLDFNQNYYRWKWNYVAPAVDVTMDITNLFWGYNPKRHFAFGVFAGVGVNIGFNNNEAVNVNNTASWAFGGKHNALENIWDGTHARFLGRLGVNLDYVINPNWSVGLELQANTLKDAYNSKLAGNTDWYFNALVGVKYTFGKPGKRAKVVPVNRVDTVYIDREKIVERVVEVPAAPQTNAVQVVETLRRDVFFQISNTVVSKEEITKVVEVAEFMKSHPDTKVVITGYADKGTGTRAINLRLSKQRAQAVTECLVKTYGIAASRIETKSMGEEEYQPYPDPVQNRVAICVVE